MWNYLKSIFAPETLFVTSSTTEASGFFADREFGDSVDGFATIRQMKNGKFRLLVNTNEVIGTYSRLRDAKRGAERKGLIVAEA